MPPSLHQHRPHLVSPAEAADLLAHFSSHGAHTVHVDLEAARSTTDVFDALKGVLPFPEWCASGWDCVDDAFEELCAAWQLPLVMVVHGAAELMVARPQLALATVLGLEDLTQSFSAAAQQLVVVYVWTVLPDVTDTSVGTRSA